MEYDDSDSDEDFRFDVAPCYAVPRNYQQLYLSPNLVPCAEDEDDGWDSDDDSCLPVVSQQEGMQQPCC